ncbi:MAG TPA: pantothenate kinase [Bacteroidales bacterium]|nr:pantothenate kinase [Bacteroidales bacterium]
MKLVIDVGNTRTKIAVFSKANIFFYKAYNNLMNNDIEEILTNFPDVKRAIFSTVGQTMNELKDYLNQKITLIDFHTELKLPINNHYLSIKTLGKDRLAGVIGANGLFPNNNCLVIDAGSCITIDLIDKEKNYYGGSISLGLNMKYKALNTFTVSLPLLNDNFCEEKLIGVNTESSIRSGVLNGTIMELKGFIDYYTKEYSDLKIIFTGGDSKILQSYFKEKTILEEHLVLMGLNIILDTNA